MKTILQYVTLISVAGVAGAAAAETAGLGVSSTWGYEVPFAAFVIALTLLTVGNDYRRTARSFEPGRAKAILLPADEVFGPAAAVVSVAGVTAPAWTNRHSRIRHQLAHN